jgi:hypothetical protein
MLSRMYAMLFAATAAALFCCTVVSAQPKSGLEQRIGDLEKRVARLEKRLGEATTQAPAPARPVPTVSSSVRAPVYSTRIPLDLKLVTKKVVKSRESGGDEIEFFVQLRNTGSRAIIGIEGDLIVKNINAQKLLEFGMSASKYIAVNDSVIWIGAVDYDSKETGQRSIVATEKSYLVVELSPEVIRYQDGSQDVYRKPEE